MLIKFLACLAYGLSSPGLTFINKCLFANFGFSSPLCLFLNQCIWNIIICTTIMTYKCYYPNAFKSLEKYGMKIPPITESIKKFNIGIKMGMSNLCTVFFGLYSVKIVNIPMFVTIRRCALLTTVLANYIVNRAVPDAKLRTSVTLSTFGAFLAGIETLTTDWFGYLLVWMNNLCQSGYNIYVNKVNKEKKVLPFEINFYFALCGLPISLLYTVISGEINEFGNTLN